MKTESRIEIDPEERGKLWTNDRLTVFAFSRFPGKRLTGAEGEVFDRDTFAKNLKWDRPSFFHDMACRYRQWDDGTPISKHDADLGYADLMLKSEYPEDRKRAALHYHGLQTFPAWLIWYWDTVTMRKTRASYVPPVVQVGQGYLYIEVPKLYPRT